MLKTMIEDPVQRKNLIKAGVAVGYACVGIYVLRRVVEKHADNEVERSIRQFPNRFNALKD